MGRVSDALERHKKEKVIKIKGLPIDRPEQLVAKRPESPLVPGLATQNGVSPEIVVLSAPESIDAENFKVLRAKILFPTNGKKPRIIMITSAFPGEGKTFVAANLAASIAIGINEHVLLIDCDLRRPALHSMLGYSNTHGLSEYLTEKKRLSDLLIRTRIKKLSLLTAGSPGPNPSELLSSTMMKDFLAEAKERYQDRYIIIDAAPSHITAEASVLSNHVDGIIFVVMAQKTPKEPIQRNIQTLGKEKILGIVFNGYSKNYRAYHKHYKKYYRL